MTNMGIDLWDTAKAMPRGKSVASNAIYQKRRKTENL